MQAVSLLKVGSSRPTSSCIHHFVTTPRDPELTSRLRNAYYHILNLVTEPIVTNRSFSAVVVSPLDRIY